MGCDVERKPRQQMFDQIGLMRTQPVTLAPSEERAVRVSDDIIVGRRVAIGVALAIGSPAIGTLGIAGGAAHRSV